MDDNVEKSPNIVSALAKDSTLKLGIGMRMLSRLTKLDLGDNIPTDATRDLAGDVFNVLYSIPQFKDDIPTNRVVNKAILDYAQNEGLLENVRQSTKGSLLVSSMTAPVFWASINDDQFLQEMLKKQQELDDMEKQKDQLEQERQEAQAGGDEEGAQALREKIEELSQDIEERSQEIAQQTQETLDTSQTARAAVMSACNEAADEGEEIKSAVKGWGMENGSYETANAEDIETVRNLLNDKTLRAVSNVIGRLTGFCMTARHSRQTSQLIPDGVQFTQDLSLIFPEELLQMLCNKGDIGTRILSTLKTIEYCDRGLLGYKLVTKPKFTGNAWIFVDQSGSMSSSTYFEGYPIGSYVLAKGLAYGMVQTLKNEDGRRYILETFSSDKSDMKQVDNDTSIADMISWLQYFPCGGTNVDLVLQEVMDNPKFVEDGADIVIITDGYFNVRNDIISNFEVFKAHTDVRLMMIIIGNYSLSAKVADVTDLILNVDDLSESNTKTIGTKLAQWIR